MDNQTGTIFLPTLTAIELWKKELRGQFSDGMWENSRPYEHWKFWCRLDVKVGPPHVEANGFCAKNAYNIAALYPIIGERMVELGRAISPGYDMKALRADVATIKTAMKTMPRL